MSSDDSGVRRAPAVPPLRVREIGCPRCPLWFQVRDDPGQRSMSRHNVRVGMVGDVPIGLAVIAFAEDGPFCQGSGAFVCPRCDAPSWSPDDAEHGYCGRCHWWTGSEVLGSPEALAQAEADGAIEPLIEPITIMGKAQQEWEPHPTMPGMFQRR